MSFFDFPTAVTKPKEEKAAEQKPAPIPMPKLSFEEIEQIEQARKPEPKKRGRPPKAKE